jgi:cysteine desulfurase
MRVYLDNGSATPPLPEVVEAMQPFLRECFASPSALYQEAHQARAAIHQAREQFARFINAQEPENILFTSNGTEAINLAIKGTFWANQKRGQHVVFSAIEHPAITNSLRFLEQFGCTFTQVSVNGDGTIDPDAIREALQADTILVAVHHANHDLGTIQPLQKIGEMLADRGIPFFVDATASAGWLPVNVADWNASLVALSPLRFYGPKGAGVLYRHRRARLAPLIDGGDQEYGKRAGSQNIPAIVGAGVAAEIATSRFSDWSSHAGQLQTKTWDNLNSAIPYIRLNGPPPGPRRHPVNLNISVEFVEGEGLALSLDVRGIALGSGAACVTQTMRIPPALRAIGLDETLAKGNILIGLGKDNTFAEIDYLVETFTRTVTMLREMSPAWDDFQKGLVDSKISPRHSGI